MADPSQAQDSVLEDVKIVVDFAKEEGLVGAEVGPGNREAYVPKNGESKFNNQSDYLGVASNLLNLNLTKWAVKGQSVPRHAAKAYGEKIVMPAARSQQTSRLLKDAVGVAVISALTPGAAGTWRRISLDLQTFGFIVCFADLIRKKPFDDETKKLIEQFKKALLHCPMDFYYFEASADLESKIFRKSFEIMEEFRKAEEVHAPGGWQVCCLFFAAKELQTQQQAVAADPSQRPAPSPSKKGSGGSQADDAQSVCLFFNGFEFAETSEYKKLDKKLSKDCLLVFERMTGAKLGRLLAGSWANLGQKNSLDGVHKLIQISQRVAAACGSQPGELPTLTSFVVKYAYFRMCAGTLDTHLGIRALRPWLSVPLMIFKLVQYVMAEFKYTKPIEQSHLTKFQDPEVWFSQVCGSQPGDQHNNPPS